MKVLLIKDVFKLGRAGDIKKVADGFGRNYLLTQGLAILATPGAMKQAESIRVKANARRSIQNEELSSIAEAITDISLTFATKAGETGKLYGSITSQMIADALKEKTGVEIDRRQVEAEPIRNLGEHKAHIRLTMDLIPEIKVVVVREGEAVKASEAPSAKPAVTPKPVAAPEPEIAPEPEATVETETTPVSEEEPEATIETETAPVSEEEPKTE